MRDAPKSLHMHLSYAGIQALKNKKISPSFDAENISENQVLKFVSGVKKYQNYPFVIPCKDRKKIWESGAVSLQQKRSICVQDDTPIILLVPSLINNSEIFDLLQNKSFMGFLGDRGAATYMLDWGEVGYDKDVKNWDDLVHCKLVPAISYLSTTYKRKVHLLGYCLGGLLALGACSQLAEGVASLTCLATPWDFHAGEARLAQRIRFFFDRPDIRMYVENHDIFSSDWMHSLLATLNPEIVVNKFIRFAELENKELEKIFVAVEDWLASSTDLSMTLAHNIYKDMVVDNKVPSNIDMQQLKCPILIIASHKDKLVEFESARALYDLLPHASFIQPDCGHIGMMAGRNALQDVWVPFFEWIGMQKKNSV